jgi:DNA-binding NtrC family response regulator
MIGTACGRASEAVPSPRTPHSALRTSSVLVVDDEPVIRDTLAEYLGQEGFQVATCASGEESLAAAQRHCFDVVLCDLHLPGIDGIEVLERLKQINPQVFVLLITAYATVENAIEAFQKGAADYLMKPIILDEVSSKIRRLLSLRDLVQENQWLRRELNRAEDAERLVGKSLVMRQLCEMIRKVAPTRSTVLLEGESGTGKELIARAIHRLGDAAREGRTEPSRFIAVNCAAIPHDLLENQLFGHRKGAFTGADRDQPGVFVHAGEGTVFLDEIAELPLATQAKLLRTIEQKEIMPVGANEPVCVDARVLAATNKDLKREVEQGRFREDLYYRINVVCIRVPPLRERREDIPELVDFLLAKHARVLGKKCRGLTLEALQLLSACPWKGNVRELDNVLQRAVILGEGPLIAPADLPPDLAPAPGDPAGVEQLAEAVRRFEKLHLERILRTSPDKKEAARRLDMGLSSLYRKIAELEIRIDTP